MKILFFLFSVMGILLLAMIPVLPLKENGSQMRDVVWTGRKNAQIVEGEGRVPSDVKDLSVRGIVHSEEVVFEGRLANRLVKNNYRVIDGTPVWGVSRRAVAYISFFVVGSSLFGGAMCANWRTFDQEQ